MSASRTVIVTGASMGLGYQCALALAADSSWHVVLASRDLAKTAAAAERISLETGNPHVEAVALDLGSLASVRAFATSYGEARRPPLAALVCNAGLQVASGLTHTVDGFETMFGVNHLGHFLLVNELLPLFIAPARIVVVSSGTHDPATVDGRFNPPIYRDAASLAWPTRPEAPRMIGIRRYATTKLCNLFFAYELDRRLRAAGRAPSQLTVNAYDPGATPGTGLTRQYPKLVQWLWGSRLVAGLLRLLGLRIYTPEISGAAMARLVLDPGLAETSGRYFHVHREVPSSTESHDLAKAAELWASSAELVGVEP